MAKVKKKVRGSKAATRAHQAEARRPRAAKAAARGRKPGSSAKTWARSLRCEPQPAAFTTTSAAIVP